MVEHLTENQGVPSSNLGLGTGEQPMCGRSSVVERLLAKEKVMGSNPTARFVRAKWRRRQVVRRGSAKPLSPVRIRPSPLNNRWSRLMATRFAISPLSMGRWRNGRRCGLKIRWRQLHEGSNPSRPIDTRSRRKMAQIGQGLVWLSSMNWAR